MDNPATADQPFLLQLVDIHKSFGKVEVLKGLTVRVAKGQVVVVIGASGSGKSTLLRCANLLEPPTQGQVILDGTRVGESRNGRTYYRERDLTAVRTKVGMVFQHFNLFPHMTAGRNVMEGPRTVLKLGRTAARERAQRYLARVGLADRFDAYPSQLSGGQKQRVAIARALAMEPEIMLFDEATSALDPELVGEVLQTMRSLAEDGMTMLIVTHELGFAYSVADWVIYLHGGQVEEAGTPEEVLRNPKSERMREFLAGYSQFQLPANAPMRDRAAARP